MESCTCKSCVNACKQKPGWFLPSQIKKASEFLCITEKQFFSKYCMVDWYEDHPESDYDNVFVVSPAIVGEEPGGMFPGDPNGLCVFHNIDELCDVHDVKPYECAMLGCSDARETVGVRHYDVAKEWIPFQDYVEKLLGKKPRASVFIPPYGGFLWQ